LKVLFFASVRERLGCAEMEFSAGSEEMTTESLREALMSRGGEAWQEALGQPNLVCAVNQTVVSDVAQLASDDEVAFFPPVTGG